jgi:hypothetical protein
MLILISRFGVGVRMEVGIPAGCVRGRLSREKVGALSVGWGRLEVCGVGRGGVVGG